MLSKLDAAELRIGMTDDAKLSKLLDPALINILGFLATPSATVRAKVMAILSHLNKRIRADASISLPLDKLAALFSNAATAPFVANFGLVYLEMGLPRASEATRASLVPKMLVDLAARPAAQQDMLLELLMGSLHALPLPRTKAALVGADATLPFLTGEADRAAVLRWLCDLLLYLPPLASAPHTPAPGLSRVAAKRVCCKMSDAEVRGELLAKKKGAALRLLGAKTDDGGVLFSTAESLPHWVVASCDNDFGVASTADAALRALQHADLDEIGLIDALTNLVVGDTPAGPAPADSAQMTRSPAPVAVRLRALSYLHRSVGAASRFPGTHRAVLHCIFGGDATPKLQQAGCQLAQWSVTHCDDTLIRTAGADLLAAMLKVLRGEATASQRLDAPEVVMMRSSAYAAAPARLLSPHAGSPSARICPCASRGAKANTRAPRGPHSADSRGRYATLCKLCQRAPANVRADPRLPAELFNALETEPIGSRSTLQEALAALADVRTAATPHSCWP